MKTICMTDEEMVEWDACFATHNHFLQLGKWLAGR